MGKKLHSALFYFVLNLIIPGLGQLALGFYIRGCVLLAGSLICCTLSTDKLLTPIMDNLQMALDGGGGTLETPDLHVVLLYGTGFILFWCWSLFEIPFLMRKKRALLEQEGKSA